MFRFLSNLFDFQSHTLVLLYKNRWEIEPFFKRIKQSFELGYFFSDSREGIKTQVWMVLIANLIFSVIHKRIKEAEQFTTLVAMARANLISYVCFETILKTNWLNAKERNLEIVQLDIFGSKQGGVEEKGKITLNSLKTNYFRRQKNYSDDSKSKLKTITTQIITDTSLEIYFNL